MTRAIEAETPRDANATLTRPLQPLDALIGRTVCDYVIERKLGEGGMGVVFLVRHVTLPRTFLALKILLRPDESMRQRFDQEAIVAAAIGSHRVPKPYTIGEIDGYPFILQDYVNGRSLDEELRKNPVLSIERVLKTGARIADTMIEAHDAGIIHRDLKPANIMLVREGDREGVRILDWGIARASGEYKRAFTKEFMVLGSPNYCAPEAAMGQPCDGRADVFSLGVILYHMLTGKLPYPKADGVDFVPLMEAEAPRPPSIERPPGAEPVPAALDALVLALVTRDRKRRPWMAEVRASLMAALKTISPSEEEPRTALSVVENLNLEPPTHAGGDDVIRRVVESYALGEPQAEPAYTAFDRPRASTVEPARPGNRYQWVAVAALVALAIFAAGVVALGGHRAIATPSAQVNPPAFPPGVTAGVTPSPAELSPEASARTPEIAPPGSASAALGDSPATAPGAGMDPSTSHDKPGKPHPGPGAPNPLQLKPLGH